MTGNISFNEVDLADPSSDIQSVTDIIRAAFKDSSQFTPTQVYNISWEGVPPYRNNTNVSQTNTFYCELASDGNSSYAVFTYVDIQWTTPDPKNTTNVPLPWIGFTASYGVDLGLAGCCVNDIVTTGNVFYPKDGIVLDGPLVSRADNAIWVFKIDDVEISPGGIYNNYKCILVLS